MKTKITIAVATFILTLAMVVSCGKKDEQPTPPPPDPTKKTPTAQAEAPKAAEKSLAQASSAALTTATNAVSSAPEVAALKPAEPSVSAPVPPTNAVPSASAPANPAPPSSTPTPALASLSQDQMVQGLQAALGKGLQQAIANLGHEGGFLTNVNVKIPMPEKLQKVESTLRTMKQDKLADDFVVTMNRAAEQAVPEAASVFADALQHMTIDDAKSILAGPNDAATQYFQKATSTNLYAKFYPIVQKATEKTGVTSAYKNLMAKADVTKSLGSLGNTISGALLDKDTMDVDAYVTSKTMDGLFKMVAEEEKQIRQNPVARTTDILQKVFGAVGK